MIKTIGKNSLGSCWSVFSCRLVIINGNTQFWKVKTLNQRFHVEVRVSTFMEKLVHPHHVNVYKLTAQLLNMSIRLNNRRCCLHIFDHISVWSMSDPMAENHCYLYNIAFCLYIYMGIMGCCKIFRAESWKAGKTPIIYIAMLRSHIRVFAGCAEISPPHLIMCNPSILFLHIYIRPSCVNYKLCYFHK
jgi:hypothetical protein